MPASHSFRTNDSHLLRINTPKGKSQLTNNRSYSSTSSAVTASRDACQIRKTRTLLLVLLNVKNDSVDTVSFAEQQMAGGEPNLFSLGNDGTPGGKPVQAENGVE
ncbi:MAG: hypothetical protein WAL71_16320 [Terriglobales bacterium]|jgi:hypothetical protein